MIQVLLIRKILQLVLIALMGYILAKCRVVRPGDSAVLSKVSLFLIMPCSILNSFQIEYDDSVISGMLLAAAAGVITHLLLILLLETAGRRAGLDTVERNSVIYSNAANLVIPIVTYVLGEEWVIYSSVYASVQLIFLWTHCVSSFQGERRIHLGKILLNLNFIAIVAGIILLVGRISLPDIAAEVVSSVASMLGPVAMLVIGILVAGMDLKKILSYRRMYLIVALRLLVIPLIALAAFRGLMAAGVIEQGSYLFLTVFIAMITPTANMITQFAQVYGGDAEYAGAINMVSTLACIVTMPVLVWLYLL